MTVVAAIGEERKENPVVTEAYQLATAFDDDLVVLHVIPEDEATEHLAELKKISDFPDPSFTEEGRRAAAFADTVVEHSLREYDRDRVTTVGRIGSPADTVLSVLSEEEDARYLVIGGRKRSPVGKALFGSTTQELLLNADRPVVTVMQS